MADTVAVARNFDRGFQSDSPRDQLPEGVAYRMDDFIPREGSPLRKRGGWAHSSKDLNTASAATSIQSVGWGQFSLDDHLIAVSETGKVYQIKSYDTSGGTYIGTTGFNQQSWRPFWHRDRIILVPGNSLAGEQVKVPHKYYSTGGGGYAVDLVGGSVPGFRVGLSWGEYLVGMNGFTGGGANNWFNRIWFSDPGDPDSWSDSFVDAPAWIQGAVVLRNSIIIWGYSDCWILTGDTPPAAGGSVGGNMSLKDLFPGVGCADGLSIATYRDYAIWANSSGVFKTDGAYMTDLTKNGGISRYWQGLSASAPRAAVWRGLYFVSPYANSPTTLVCDIEREVWFEFTHFPATIYGTRPAGYGGSEELFFGNAGSPRVQKVSTCWTPSSTYATDADGSAILPVLETPYYKLGATEEKRVRRVYVTHDLRDTGATNPTLQVGYITSPEATGYTTLPKVLAETTAQKRRPLDIRQRALGVGLKIAQTASSGDTRIAEIELEAHALEKAKR